MCKYFYSEIKNDFENSYNLNESIFTALKGEPNC